MGSPISQVAQSTQPTQPQGKGFAQPRPNDQIYGGPFQDPNMDAPAVMPQQQQMNRPMGKGGRITYPGQSGQPQYGRPNQYSNTVGPWDNATIGNQQPQTFRSGKGKGA